MSYQAVEPQAVEPPMAAARMKASTSLLMTQLLSRGTNGKPGYTPFEGRTQVVRSALTRLRAGDTRTFLWVFFLWSAAAGAAAALFADGYRLNNPGIVLGLAV